MPKEFDKNIQEATNPLPGAVPCSIQYKLAVKQKYEGLTVLDFYNQAIPSVAREIWLEKILSGNLTVNSKSITPETIVKAGWITEHSSEPKTEPKVSNNIKLIHEDEHILVINKPAPLPMHASGRFVKNTLISFLNLAFTKQKFKLIHRIDANTTGVIVIGKSDLATQKLNTQFKNQTVKKEYIALVEGVINEDTFSIDKSIGIEQDISGSRKSNTMGKAAFTEFKVIKRYQDKSLLSIKPHSGRTNQIRIHLADIGHPIVGDYGYKDEAYFKNNPLTYPDDCLFLHAHRITIEHPIKLKNTTFTAEIPEKFLALS